MKIIKIAAWTISGLYAIPLLIMIATVAGAVMLSYIERKV